MFVNFVSVICMVLALSMIVLGIFKFVSGFISGRDHSSVGSGAVMLVAGMLIIEWEFYYLKPNGDKQKISPQYYNYSSYNVVFDEEKHEVTLTDKK